MSAEGVGVRVSESKVGVGQVLGGDVQNFQVQKCGLSRETGEE